MTAFEARKTSIMSQYRIAKLEIETACEHGLTSTTVLKNCGAIQPEVGELLAKDGYTVNVRCNINEVSWNDAKEGERGSFNDSLRIILL